MRLIRGAPGTGKTALILREFTAAIGNRAGVRPRVIVPTATLVRHLRHELAREGVVFPPSAIVSLHKFIGECAPGIRPVPPALLPAIVRECLETLRPAEFSRLLTADGLAATVIETIGILENAGCMSDGTPAPRGTDPVGRAFLKLWRAIDQAIRERGFVTRAELVRRAASATPAGKVWMDGFLAFSPLEEEFVAALARSAELTLSLTDTPASEDMRRFALRLGASDHLLTGPARRPEPEIVEAPSLEAEATEIARRVLSLQRDGTAFRRIGVALRDNAAYLTLLQSTFERFGIPARSYFGHSLSTHPVAVFAEGLIAGVLSGWDFEATLATLRTHPRWGHSADFDRFDFAVRKAMPGRGAAELVAHCESAWLKRELTECLRIDLWKTTLDRPAAWRERIAKLLAAEYRPGRLAEPGGHRDIALSRSHVAAPRALTEALETAAGCFAAPDQPVTLEHFWRVASQVIANAVYRLPDDRVDVLHVMSVYEARQWDLDALFVCGMTDRDFPLRRAPNLFFADAVLERMTGRARSLQQQEKEEFGLFESLKTRASKSVVFTYPKHDAGGRSVQSSRFFAGLTAGLTAVQTNIPVRPALPAPPPAGRAGRIADPALTAGLVQIHRRASMSSLEDLAQCRFKFFASRTLGLEAAPERPGDRLQPRLTGSILHKALETWQTDRSRDFVELFDEAFEKARHDENLPPGYRLEVKRLEFRAIATRVSATEQWSYESSEVEVPLSVGLSLGVTVSTRIDRLDLLGGNDCVIVDYKSGKTAGVKQKLESENHLQGPLYALAVREHRGLNPVAVVFWAVREDERHGWGHIAGASDAVNSSLWEMPADWATAARIRIEERLSGFLNGAVTVQPADPSQCRWCDFADACRVEVQGTEEQQLVVIGHA